MKRIIYSIVVLLFCVVSQAQNVSGSLNTRYPFDMQVGENTTTIIAYPFAVVEVDRGTNNLMVSKVPGVENVLKLKAAHPFSDTTSLHVFTADGKIHVFRVSYNPRPSHLFYEWKEEEKSSSFRSLVRYEEKPYNQMQLLRLADSIRNKPPFLYRRIRKSKMQFWLQGIYHDSTVLIAKFRISNHSPLSYKAGFSELYLFDKKQGKRTSHQQILVLPLFVDPLQTINGYDDQQWLLIIPKMTIPVNKKLRLLLYEKNGGRNLKFEIKNRDLLRAKPM